MIIRASSPSIDGCLKSSSVFQPLYAVRVSDQQPPHRIGDDSPYVPTTIAPTVAAYCRLSASSWKYATIHCRSIRLRCPKLQESINAQHANLHVVHKSELRGKQGVRAVCYKRVNGEQRRGWYQTAMSHHPFHRVGEHLAHCICERNKCFDRQYDSRLMNKQTEHNVLSDYLQASHSHYSASDKTINTRAPMHTRAGPYQLQQTVK